MTAGTGERITDTTAPPMMDGGQDGCVDVWFHPESGEVIVPDQFAVPPPSSRVCVSYEIDETGDGPYSLKVHAADHDSGLRHSAAVVQSIAQAIGYTQPEDPGEGRNPGGIQSGQNHGQGIAQGANQGDPMGLSPEGFGQPDPEDIGFIKAAWSRGREKQLQKRANGRFFSRHPVLRNKLIGGLSVAIMLPFAVDLGMDIERNILPPTNFLSTDKIFEVHWSDWSPMRAVDLFRRVN